MAWDDQDAARRWGADAYDGARARRSGSCFVLGEMVLLGVVGGMYAAGAHHVSTPTSIAIGLIVAVVGLVLSRLPVIGALVGLLLAAGWGYLAGSIAALLGNQLLGIVVGILVGLVVAGLHLGYRR